MEDFEGEDSQPESNDFGGNSGGGSFRQRRFNRGPRRSFGGPREMHKATCSECGQECEVPFKPVEGRPVYCKECYRKKRPF
ncbi:DNA-directed RNA polymerase [Candidatus Woesearchaeota archaeon]|nr:DNA-directed RNA polymerase [Candidatus Woesearchaeota archaeon]